MGLVNFNRISNEALTLLKWIAVLAMVADHYNVFLNDNQSEFLKAVGRFALPLFVFVIGYNLARMPVKKMPKMVFRLVAFGLLSLPPYIALGAPIRGWWPLNILFTFAAAVLVVYLLSLRPVSKAALVALRGAAIVLFLVAGVVVEYFWPALGLVLSVWLSFRLAKKNILGRLGALAAGCLWLIALNDMNGNLWAMAALPLIAGVWALPVGAIKLPRGKWFFYWFYPVHFYLIWMVLL